MLRFFLLVGGLLIFIPLPAQSSDYDITGDWHGILRQNEGGIAEVFEIYLRLRQIGPSVRGTSFVRLEDGEYNILVEIRLHGTQEANGNWRLTEVEVLREDLGGKRDLYVCYKEYDLRVELRKDQVYLTGPWWGQSILGNPCVPGTVTLKRQKFDKP